MTSKETDKNHYLPCEGMRISEKGQLIGGKDAWGDLDPRVIEFRRIHDRGCSLVAMRVSSY
jgi:hypothetical protein